MSGRRELKIVITGDARDGERAVHSAAAATVRFGDSVSRVGRVVGAALVGTGAAVGAFAVKAVASASDLNETVSKVGVVFGQQAAVVGGFADRMARDFGLPKREILDAAAAIGLIGKASGLSQGDAAVMSTRLAELAADASSFYNVPLPEVLEAIRSGLVGEAEPMRRFGVLLNEAAVEAEATRLGLRKVNGEFDEGAKAQARASLILAGMKDASGDLARTQGSLANRLRELRGRAENFAASVGTVLLPLVLRAFDAFERLQQVVGPPLRAALASLAATLRASFDTGLVRTFIAGFRGETIYEDIAGLDRVVARLGETLSGLVDFVGDKAVPALTALGVVVGTVLVGAVVSLGSALVAAFSPVYLIVGAIALLAAGLVWAYQRFEGFRAVVDAVVTFLTGVVVPAVAAFASYLAGQFGSLVSYVVTIWPQVSEAVGHVMHAIEVVVGVVLAVVLGLWHAVGDDILHFVQARFDFIRSTIENALQLIRGVVQTVLALVNGDWGKALDGLRDIAGAVFGQIGNVVSTAVGTLRAVVGGFLSLLGTMGRAAFDATVAVVPRIVAALLPGVDEVVAVGGQIVEGLARGIRNAIAKVVAAVKELLSHIPGPVKKLLRIESPSKVMMALGAQIAAGLAVGIEGGVAEVGRATERLARASAVAGSSSLDGHRPATASPVPVTVEFRSDLHVHGGTEETLAAVRLLLRERDERLVRVLRAGPNGALTLGG